VLDRDRGVRQLSFLCRGIRRDRCFLSRFFGRFLKNFIKKQKLLSATTPPLPFTSLQLMSDRQQQPPSSHTTTTTASQQQTTQQIEDFMLDIAADVA
jgi:hypothetical protein